MTSSSSCAVVGGSFLFFFDHGVATVVANTTRLVAAVVARSLLDRLLDVVKSTMDCIVSLLVALSSGVAVASLI